MAYETGLPQLKPRGLHSRKPRRSSIVVSEVAAHRVPDHFLQVVPVLALREDAVAERPGVVSAFGGFGHVEDNLVAAHLLFVRV